MKFTLIPLSFLVTRAPGTVFRVLEYLGVVESGQEGWAFIMAIGDASQGDCERALKAFSQLTN